MGTTGNYSLTIAEMQEFAGFTPAEQRYIRRSLDVALCRDDACRRWARDADENRDIRRQLLAYQTLQELRDAIPFDGEGHAMEDFLGRLIVLAARDLVQERLTCFSAFRFLYERLLGAQARPWLPPAFCGAAALPQIRPAWRRQLLQSISETAATAPGWSNREPGFFPKFIALEEV
ncbi:hypothetical protein [Pseudopontixanthobacter vadosimaris]|uniref:hypothetical protein n=1 Tax=Pseudopontixanthobacter vadosimaris TaxID=2726450 RepID=UPI0014728FEE|nr:hypothetical protein [Pseudopontixanthobacter vadosimaris]